MKFKYLPLSVKFRYGTDIEYEKVQMQKRDQEWSNAIARRPDGTTFYCFFWDYTEVASDQPNEQ